MLQLVDDPDTEVFSRVEDRLKTYGLAVVPELENLWENTISEEVQGRIEMIIHGIHYRNLTDEFVKWRDGGAELLHGALLVAKYQYPELQAVNALQEIERMRRNIWLEMNSYMTPLEQVKVVESILYNYYKMRGGEIAYERQNEFLLHKVIESKKGNAITNGILYIVLSELLDMPVRVINLPQQFVLAWFSQQALFENSYGNETDPAGSIKFYVDPNSGIAFSHKDVSLYLKRSNLSQSPAYFKPLANQQIITLLLQQFALCFDNLTYSYKKQELEALAELVSG